MAPASSAARAGALATLVAIHLASTATARAAEPAPARPAAVEAVSLGEAVRRALARNPAAEVAALEIARFEALSQQARAGWLPTVSGNASYTRLEGNRFSTSAAPLLIAGQDQLAGSLTVAAPLLAPRPITQYRRSRDDLETARQSAAEVRRQLALAVGRAWLQLLAQHRVIEVAERAEVTARAHHLFARQQFEGGYGTRLDEVRANQEVQSDRAQVEQARVLLERLREALAVLVGADHPVDVVSGIDGSGEARPLFDLPAPPPASQAGDEALRTRSDVKLSQQRLAAAERVVRDRWADYAPSLVAVFQPFIQRQYDMPSTVPQAGWAGQVALSLPLYDGGLRYGQQRERAALAGEARVTLEGTLRQAASEVRAAIEASERATAALAAAREAGRLAREGLQLSDLAYRAGASTNIEVIDAERRARDAETAVALAEDAERQALLDLLIASGRFP